MCLIIAAEKARPDDDVIVAGARMNSDGIGVAWIGTAGTVQWRKGITVRDALDLARDLPFPWIMHLRLATAGSKSLALAHPFQIEEKPSDALSGATPGPVLFHNGHVSEWEAIAAAAGITIPEDGSWSDSRALAAVVSRAGRPVLDALASGQRFAILSPSKGILRWGTWAKEAEGYALSSYLMGFGMSPTNVIGSAYEGLTAADYGDATAGRFLDEDAGALAFVEGRPRTYVSRVGAESDSERWARWARRMRQERKAELRRARKESRR